MFCVIARYLALPLVVTSLLTTSGCSDDGAAALQDSGSCDGDTDSATDADVDTDTDTDTDTDADSDTDTATGTDTDSDSDTDTDTGSDTGSDPCIEPDTDTQCQGQDDFVFCSVDTGPLYGVDYGYDICVGEVCLSPGSCGHACCNAPGPHFPLPPAIIESPGYTRSEPAPGEPVVEDPATGLVWQGCPAGMDGDLASCSGAADALPWADALVLCDDLAWGGWDDWYLPDPWELQSIAHYGAWCAAVDPVAFPDTPWEWFWTSSSRASDPGQAWYISAVNGVVACAQKDEFLHVRCVRRDAGSAPVDRFVRTEPLDGEPVVEDLATGLMWQGCAGGMEGDLISCDGSPISGLPPMAVAYCDLLEWGSHDDWYLADVRELASILELREVEPPLVDWEAFPDTPHDDPFWSGTPYAPAPVDYFWDIGFSNGYSTTYDAMQGGYGRCVRTVP